MRIFEKIISNPIVLCVLIVALGSGAAHSIIQMYYNNSILQGSYFFILSVLLLFIIIIVSFFKLLGYVASSLGLYKGNKEY